MTTYVRHQAVRWINTKEEHAARILDNMSNYMLAQRVKPPAETTGPKQDQYVKLLLVCLLVYIFAMLMCHVGGQRGIPSVFVHALLEDVLSCMQLFLSLTDWCHVRRLYTR